MLTSFDVRCMFVESLGDKGLFLPANLLQRADVVRRVDFLLFLILVLFALFGLWSKTSSRRLHLRKNLWY